MRTCFLYPPPSRGGTGHPPKPRTAAARERAAAGRRTRSLARGMERLRRLSRRFLFGEAAREETRPERRCASARSASVDRNRNGTAGKGPATPGPTDPPPLLYVARHAERLDAPSSSRARAASEDGSVRGGIEWLKSEPERPWDPPITRHGRAQGWALGYAVASDVLQRHGKTPRQLDLKIFTSPLLRCVETAVAAAEAMHIDAVHVDDALMEVISRGWYSGWNNRDGVLREDARAFANASTLIPSAAELHGAVSTRIVATADHASGIRIHDMRISIARPETWTSLVRRTTSFIQRVALPALLRERRPVLCVSHAGNCRAFVEWTRMGTVPMECFGFANVTTIAPPARERRGRWRILRLANVEHLSEDSEAMAFGEGMNEDRYETSNAAGVWRAASDSSQSACELDTDAGPAA